MKKIYLAIAILALTLQTSCKKEGTTEENTPSTETTATSENETKSEDNTAMNTPKTYTVTATPEVSILGKKSEAEVKVINLKALELSDPDGKITGIEFTYQIEVTNKNLINGGSIFITPSEFRLELDNGNKISHESYNSIRVKEEETKTSETQTFKIPAGTKPVNLHLFFDETRAVVKLDMQ
ncbi:hypothetical protein LXD69_06090 [Flavobacterium sediminilitoris]|uniref:DUF4352 domain-containing protein n=1 Tax=Flavobacterium sediminilitoris TaxID=2024526 RepID=A0ABY4HU37_9FLAO|nr:MULTISPECIES: hypothetical protein [Flavobacterium]UOX35079.1 hypothetical protein LXD69_06090 [Flavobacterium sediminilitoris]